jgi:hypothetical protein
MPCPDFPGLNFPEDLFRFLRIIPKTGLSGKLFFFADAFYLFIIVKDTPSRHLLVPLNLSIARQSFCVKFRFTNIYVSIGNTPYSFKLGKM